MARNSDYQKGYAAGRRRANSERFDRFYTAAMTGLLAGGEWQKDGKPDRSPKDYAVTAKHIAEAMVEVVPHG